MPVGDPVRLVPTRKLARNGLLGDHSWEVRDCGTMPRAACLFARLPRRPCQST